MSKQCQYFASMLLEPGFRWNFNTFMSICHTRMSHVYFCTQKKPEWGFHVLVKKAICQAYTDFSLTTNTGHIGGVYIGMVPISVFQLFWYRCVVTSQICALNLQMKPWYELSANIIFLLLRENWIPVNKRFCTNLFQNDKRLRMKKMLR